MQQKSFHKVFLLVLLIVMGTTLMNCTNKNGSKQRIDSIEVIDTINNSTIDILGDLPKMTEIDSLEKSSCSDNSTSSKIQPIINPIGIIEVENYSW